MRLREIFQRPGSTTNTVSFVLICFAIASSSWASQKKEARVTQVIQDVKLLAGGAAPRPAAVNDNVREGTAVRTGLDSRTELTFTDQTLTRLGANSVFSFNPEDRTFDLGQGAILMSVPPNGSSVKVKTAAVTAAITGGTAIFGAGPPPKFMVLEGTGTFYPTGHPELAITLHGGEMVTLLDGKLVKQEFNVKLVMESSELIVPFEDLPNLALIWDIVFEQEGDGTQPANHQYDDIDERDQSIAASQGAPSGPSGKFGAPQTIGSPIPYQINSGTEIQTDPTITTNGVTDQGKIYRGPADDGPSAEWFFGSTTAFETASGFDQIIGGAIDLPVAVFKFQSLQLTGDPTISVGDGAPVDLALISIDDMSSGGPGGPLTFAGISHLLLATQAGSIDLGSEISFENIGHVIFYARGAGSNLTLASPISGGALVHLNAEGTVQVNGDISVTNDFTSFSGGDFQNPNAVITATIVSIQSFSNITLDAEDIPDVSGGTLNFDATDTLTINVSGGTVDRSAVTLQGGTINLNSPGVVTLDFSLADAIFTAGLGGFNAPNVDLAGRNMTLTSLGNIDIRSLFLDEATRTITVTAGNLLTVAGSFSISLDKSNLGDGGNIVVGSGSDFTADEVTLEIFATAPSGAGGNITVNVGGSMNTGAVSLRGSFATENPQGPGENVTLQVTQDLTVQGGKDDAGISLTVITPVHQTLTSGANVTLDVGGNVMTATYGGTSLFINNNINEVVTGSNIAATIGGTLTTDDVSAVIYNQSGQIGTGGNMIFQVGGALTVSGDVTFQLFNNEGTIGSGGNIDVTALDNVAVNTLSASIDNSSGSIGSGGKITFDIDGTLTTTSETSFTIDHTNASSIPAETGIDVTADQISVGGDLNAYINRSGEDGSAVQIESLGGITVAGRLNVLGTVSAVGAITANTIASTNVESDTSIGAASGGITRFAIPSQLPPDILHTLSAPIVTSAGGINFNGTNADGDFSMATDAGDLTINADSLSFGAGVSFLNQLNGPIVGPDIIGSVTFNGGNGSGVPGFEAGSGGTFTVNTTGDITVSSDIEATTGAQPDATPPAGAGGTVNLNSTSGAVTVNNRIEVSSAEPSSTEAPTRRRSAQGGNIKITSGKTSGSAINISSTAQLLSLLDGAAPGPGGTIELSATSNGSIDINNTTGRIEADQGTIDINHNGTNAAINITNANMIADVIKIQILGNDGTLTIGGGTIDANSALHLFAAGSNGSIVFNANVTLSSASAAIIAANTVTINNGVTVFIDSSNMALVYANVRNYSGSGGNGSTTGIFGGAGATSAAFPPPPPPPSASSASSSTSTVAAMSTAASSGGLTLPATSSTSKTGSLIAKNLATAPKLAALRPVANQTTAGKTVMNLANSTELLSLLETGSEAGGKLTVAKPSARNRVAQSQTTNSTNLRRGNVVQRGTAIPASKDNVATTPAKAPVSTTPVNNSVARPLATAAY